MSFSEKIAQLQSIYRLQHDLVNKIANANFAEERGHLSDEDRVELGEMNFEYNEREKEEIALREKIKLEFPDEYAQHLKELYSKLSAIQNHLLAMKGELAFHHSFNATICKGLLSNLSSFMQDKKAQYSLNWLFDVSASLVEQYKTELKL